MSRAYQGAGSPAQNALQSVGNEIPSDIKAAHPRGRRNHTSAERKYRDGLNQSIGSLSVLIEEIVSKDPVFDLQTIDKPSKTTTLCAAAEMIDRLQVAIKAEADLNLKLESEFDSVADQVQCDECPVARLINQKSKGEGLAGVDSVEDLEFAYK
ncbi:hypothetical protein AUEXF2481DRAFT_532294 [Aureobasidium subglaciale EXF-2481]|uniref:BHLH domain-containing protein n=1 Tax=Aureobasidium subglaciale (strain EXF-2481) TaxID=1043005 RepID=A0A074Y9C7_AURSE|nr:uncharacterized protein AUEXF2481DRAFT_532294 [Aureobasidium subglaciale EXF-2481]KEQ90782.1 hypothetical protein AUEXF2481DRAFT_532294 [Aureobasidium subglaciale EXF-2481]